VALEHIGVIDAPAVDQDKGLGGGKAADANLAAAVHFIIQGNPGNVLDHLCQGTCHFSVDVATAYFAITGRRVLFFYVGSGGCNHDVFQLFSGCLALGLAQCSSRDRKSGHNDRHLYCCVVFTFFHGFHP